MLELGGRIFRVNIIQVSCIIICFMLAIWAKSLSINTASLSITDFISGSIHDIFEGQHSYSAVMNIWVPIVLYAISSLLLLGMGVANFIGLSEEIKSHSFLRVLVGTLQIGLFGWFAFEVGKMFIYVAALGFFLMLIGVFLIFLLSPDKNE
jgi:hypothetical protein